MRRKALFQAGQLFFQKSNAMLLYKFEAAIPWRVALSLDETGKTLPTEGAPWRPSGSLEAKAGQTFMGVPLAEILGTIASSGHFIFVTTPQ
jgi:hypothetical protein